ncbi:TIGR04211 family SH3 domain-containing protein [Halieaceae bacterium IMCC8485]|uniref:TIGR04211 family SH3 domain-containing protein n=1 Tax=Candidatus Seongchinamella marina TaxID=2518990 RepID=A0ABT3SRS4_9GAMM|nr:TIGR04211 family SH3 domain-containing protein [Candidatus Seongchinamella marina]MCX2972681.1 TIGR04211 family SH3 domain-containing protein [Candidatus Seongchinamella marina]
MLRYLSVIAFVFAALPAQAQAVKYVSDEVFVVLHKGPGAEYRWVAKLTPGTRLRMAGTAEDGEWAEVTTDRGTTGWVSTEFLSSDTPAQVRLPAAEARAAKLSTENAELNNQVAALEAEKLELLKKINSSDSELGDVSQELSNLQQVSGKAMQLDTDNRRLIEETENLRAGVDMLEAENLRLQDNLKSEDFINGALAVMMGVFITLVVPRLWPKRRKSSSWA